MRCSCSCLVSWCRFGGQSPLTPLPCWGRGESSRVSSPCPFSCACNGQPRGPHGEGVPAGGAQPGAVRGTPSAASLTDPSSSSQPSSSSRRRPPPLLALFRCLRTSPPPIPFLLLLLPPPPSPSPPCSRPSPPSCPCSPCSVPAGSGERVPGQRGCWADTFPLAAQAWAGTPHRLCLTLGQETPVLWPLPASWWPSRWEGSEQGPGPPGVCGRPSPCGWCCSPFMSFLSLVLDLPHHLTLFPIPRLMLGLLFGCTGHWHEGTLLGLAGAGSTERPMSPAMLSVPVAAGMMPRHCGVSLLQSGGSSHNLPIPGRFSWYCDRIWLRIYPCYLPRRIPLL